VDGIASSRSLGDVYHGTTLRNVLDVGALVLIAVPGTATIDIMTTGFTDLEERLKQSTGMSIADGSCECRTRTRRVRGKNVSLASRDALRVIWHRCVGWPVWSAFTSRPSLHTLFR
jgi:hypothetical protein